MKCLTHTGEQVNIFICSRYQYLSWYPPGEYWTCIHTLVSFGILLLPVILADTNQS